MLSQKRWQVDNGGGGETGSGTVGAEMSLGGDARDFLSFGVGRVSTPCFCCVGFGNFVDVARPRFSVSTSFNYLGHDQAAQVATSHFTSCRLVGRILRDSRAR